jgi:glycosyltransferase involved in cell wall biosynthesis
VRVLQSFPHKIGAARICTTAWWEVVSVAQAGGQMTVYAGAVQRPLPADVRTRTTLARGRLRIPYKVVGTRRALAIHDHLVARALPGLADSIDIVHTWPLAGLQTLRTAKRLGITTVIERPNAHTRYAMESVKRECERIGVALPVNQEHAYNARKLHQEEQEYDLGDFLLCPSRFVAQTFREAGFTEERLLSHGYGYDDQVYFPQMRDEENGVLPPGPAGATPTPTSTPIPSRRGDGNDQAGLQALFVGVCAVRKGVHFALEAWLRSPASETGTFRIAGEFLPDYEEKLAAMLAHPSVQVLGHRDDVPELMRHSDLLMLPSIEEGSPLVCMEAVASGCVPLVSEVCDAVSINDNALVHRVGDVEALAGHLTLLHEDRAQLHRMREACLAVAPTLTWRAAGRRLLDAYEQAMTRSAQPRAKLVETHARRRSAAAFFQANA